MYREKEVMSRVFHVGQPRSARRDYLGRHRSFQEQNSRSIRVLARATGEDHSWIARILKVLELPQRALEALKRNADNVRLRAHFTERHLRQLVRENLGEAAILHGIEQGIQGCARCAPNPTSPHS